MASTDAITVEILVMYKNCRRNHAAPDRGYLLYDGCCQYQSRSESASGDALLCAACNCHRSFHRRVQLDLPPQYSSVNSDQRHQPGSNTVIVHREPASAPPQAAAAARRQRPTPSPTPTSPSTDSAAADRAQQEAPTQQGASAVRRKRKTREQIEMLRALCDRNGWKLFREYSPEEVVRICSDIGISRNSLKSWISVNRRKRLASMLRFN